MLYILKKLLILECNTEIYLFPYLNLRLFEAHIIAIILNITLKNGRKFIS